MKNYKYAAVAFFVGLLLTGFSCKKNFLEVVPKGEQVAITYSDYNLLMNGSNFYVLGGARVGIWTAAAIMGDEVSAESYAYNLPRTGYPEADALFQWTANVFPLNNTNSTDNGANNPPFMSTLLVNIYSLNKIIHDVQNATDGTAQQKLELQSEAKVERAFTNFQLINYFTQPYSSATAATDPGFPIITDPDVQAETFSRGTVQQSYDFMLGDLTQAIPNLSIQPVGPTRISKAAAEALLGKIYLFMGQYANALTQFNNAFSDMAKMTAPPALYNYNQTLAPGGSFQPFSVQYGPNSPFLDVVDVKESLWAVFTYAGQYNGNQFPTDFLTLPAKTIALFDPSDWRLKFYTNLETDQKTPIPGGRLHRNNLRYARIGVELPDLYLLKAEAEARTGDLAAAATDVETLRANRIPPTAAAVPASATANAAALIKFIIDERTREFAQEGARWFDMRRLSADPLFPGISTSQHMVYSDATNATVYTLTSARLTLHIPPLYLSQNPGMVDNP